MLYIDVGNTLMGGLRTGIQRVVRSLSYELAVNSGVETRLIAFDVGAGRYFALANPVLIRSAESLGDIGREARVYFDDGEAWAADLSFPSVSRRYRFHTEADRGSHDHSGEGFNIGRSSFEP
jgi:hypothetical protein